MKDLAGVAVSNEKRRHMRMPGPALLRAEEASLRPRRAALAQPSFISAIVVDMCIAGCGAQLKGCEWDFEKARRSCDRSTQYLILMDFRLCGKLQKFRLLPIFLDAEKTKACLLHKLPAKVMGVFDDLWICKG